MQARTERSCPSSWAEKLAVAQAVVPCIGRHHVDRSLKSLHPQLDQLLGQESLVHQMDFADPLVRDLGLSKPAELDSQN